MWKTKPLSYQALCAPAWLRRGFWPLCCMETHLGTTHAIAARLPRVQRLQTHPVLLRFSIRIFVQAGSATIQLKRPGLMSLGIISCLMFLAESLLEVFEGCQSMSKLMSILYNCMVFLEFFSCKVRHVKFRSFHLRWSQLQLHTWQVSITGMNASWLQPQTAEVPGAEQLRNMSCSRTNRRTTIPCHGWTWHGKFCADPVFW